jgi:hypothetical protein
MALGAGPPKGSKNAAYPGMWRDALRRACARDKGTIDRVAKALIKAAEEGDISAIKEFGDRMDGKSQAYLELSGTVDIKETFAEAVKNATEKKESSRTGIKYPKPRAPERATTNEQHES